MPPADLSPLLQQVSDAITVGIIGIVTLCFSILATRIKARWSLPTQQAEVEKAIGEVEDLGIALPNEERHAMAAAKVRERLPMKHRAMAKTIDGMIKDAVPKVKAARRASSVPPGAN